MHQKAVQRIHRTLAVGLTTAVLGGIASPPADAQPLVTVRVTIERIRALDDFEGGGAEDFYACVTIGGVETCNEDTPSSDAFEDMEDISPNWEFSRQVDSSPGSIAVSIEIRDEDGFLRLGDDHVDVVGNTGRNVDVTVTFVPCAISGDVSGACDSTIISSGNEDEKAELRFKIEVGAAPSAPNLNLTCVHSPLWPQATDTVTVTATALDGSLAPNTADTIELWINDKTTPAKTDTSVGATSTTVGPFAAGTSFFYGCRVFDGAEEVWSGWRVVQVGTPAGGRAVPVVNTGPQASRIDIVFIPDMDNYTGPSDPVFQNDVATMIGAYYSEPTFLKRQDHLNFWIALDVGDAQDDCNSTPPSNWDDDYTFADAGAITHRDSSIRDCAPGGDRIFSGDATRMDGGLLGRVFLHETGHRPFGLADEYPPDGGYFMGEPFVNMYGPAGIVPSEFFETLCKLDIPLLQPFDVMLGSPPRTEAACRSMVTEDGTVWLSDPENNHLMDDNLAVRGADLRQIEYLFAQCRLAGC
jgi:hypothetical protein